MEIDPENAECFPNACRGDVVVFLWVLGAARDENDDRGACSGTAGKSGASALVKVTRRHAPELLGSIFADCELRSIGGRALLLLLLGPPPLRAFSLPTSLAAFMPAPFLAAAGAIVSEGSSADVIAVVGAVAAPPPGSGNSVVGNAAPPEVKVKPDDSNASGWSEEDDDDDDELSLCPLLLRLAFERCNSPNERSSRRSSRSCARVEEKLKGNKTKKLELAKVHATLELSQA